MSALSALLARDQVVPLQKIDEAIQRQVINGGDFETNLLEIDAIAEETLAAYCAALHEAEPIGRDEIASAELGALSRLTRELAESFRVVPVREAKGVLVVAAQAPIDPPAREALEAAAGLPLEVRIGTPFGVAWALWKFYGTDLSPRLQRLAARLSSRPAGQASARSVRPSTSVPSRSSVPPPTTDAAKLNAALAAFELALDDERSTALSEGKDSVRGTPSEPSETAPGEIAAETTQSSGSAGAIEIEPEPAIQHIEKPAPPKHETPARAQTEIDAPARLPLSIEQAKERIAAAQGRDAIIAALVEFAAARLAYLAIFVVQGDVAEGIEARGAGLQGEAVRGIAVPLDAPGAFRSVRERGEPVVGPPGSAPTDAVVREDLRRAEIAAVALLPVHIGGRVVLMVWLDNGPAPLDLAVVNDVVTVCGYAAQAFERLILERKRNRGIAAPRASVAATDASRVTAGEISQRVAEQRGIQALRALVASGTMRAEPAAGTVTALAPEPSTLSAPQVMAQKTEETSSGQGFTDQAGITTSTRGTMFARGGRVPIAVDIVGPLPGPVPLSTTTRQPSSERVDPRREPDDSLTQGSAVVDEFARLVTEIVRIGALSDAAANALLGGGEAALEALFRHFPGPTSFDRLNTQARVPPVAEVGPLLRLVVMFRQASTPYLIQCLDSPDADRRYFATLCLGEVVTPAALPHLLQRLFDPDFPTRVIAVDVLRAYRRFAEFDTVVRALRSVVLDASAMPERRRVAANALGELRDAEAVPVLIAALDDPDRALASLARRSLVVLARQDFGEHSAQWREWWERAAGKHRIEWLIEALLHADPTLRHDASEELKKITGQFFGYYFNLPKRERERAYRRYVEWWHAEGRARFLR